MISEVDWTALIAENLGSTVDAGHQERERGGG